MPKQHLFNADGTLKATAWQNDVEQLLARARAEALGRSEESIQLPDLMIALIDTPLFRNAVGIVSTRLIKLLREHTHSGGQGPLPQGPIRRRHFDNGTLAIIEEVSASIGTRAIGTHDLLLGILRRTIPDIDQCLSEVGLERLWLLQTIETSGSQSCIPELGGSTSTTTSSRPKPIELFNVLGDLRNEAVSQPVFEALMSAAKEASTVGDKLIEPLHIFIALICSPRVQRELGVPAKDRTTFNSPVHSAIYAVFGKNPIHPPQLSLSERRSFSSEALDILRRAALSSKGPLQGDVLLTELQKCLDPQLMSQLINHLLTSQFEWLAARLQVEQVEIELSSSSISETPEEPVEAPARVRVFISYSHKDKHWLEKLNVYLKPLIRECDIDIWHDQMIRPGEHWHSKIQDALSNAHIAVLLISQHFLASDFIVKQELPQLLDAQSKRGLKVLPVIVRLSAFLDTPLAEYQAVNDPEKPLNSLKPPDQDVVLKRVADRIREIVTSAGGR